MNTPRGGSGMRLRGMVRKEFLQILRDPSSMAIAFLLPLVLLLIFGYGVSMDAKSVPLALVADRPGTQSASLFSSFRQSEFFAPIEFANLRTAREAMRRHRVDGIVHLQSDFAERVQRLDGAAIQVIVNGVDANTARLVEGYAQGAWQAWLQRHAREQGQPFTIPVTLQSRIWYNPAVRSTDYLVPGLIAVIMTLIGALLTAMVVAREWERGTMEALLVTPIAMREVLLGKLIPYFVLGEGGMLLSVSMAVGLFDVPLRGSWWILLGTGSLFLLAALGMGLLISIIARSQFVAGQVAIIVTFLPAFILSGFIFDIDSMPTVVQWITHIIAARYFVSILQSLFLAGDIWSVIVPNALALAAMALFFLGLARRKARKRLD